MRLSILYALTEQKGDRAHPWIATPPQLEGVSVKVLFHFIQTRAWFFPFALYFVLESGPNKNNWSPTADMLLPKN